MGHSCLNDSVNVHALMEEAEGEEVAFNKSDIRIEVLYLVIEAAIQSHRKAIRKGEDIM